MHFNIIYLNRYFVRPLITPLAIMNRICFSIHLLLYLQFLPSSLISVTTILIDLTYLYLSIFISLVL